MSPLEELIAVCERHNLPASCTQDFTDAPPTVGADGHLYARYNLGSRHVHIEIPSTKSEPIRLRRTHSEAEIRALDHVASLPVQEPDPQSRFLHQFPGLD